MDSSGRPALIRSAQLIEDCVALGIRFVFETQSERIVVARVHGHEDGVDVFVPSKRWETMGNDQIDTGHQDFIQKTHRKVQPSMVAF